MTDEQIQTPVAPQPAQPQPTAPQPAAPTPQLVPAAPAKKSNVWLWILGGCLMIFILIGAAIIAAGWWGVRKVKNEIKKNQPKLEQMQESAEKWSKNAEKWSEDAEEWREQAEEFEKSLPNPEDLQIPVGLQ